MKVPTRRAVHTPKGVASTEGFILTNLFYSHPDIEDYFLDCWYLTPFSGDVPTGNELINLHLNHGRLLNTNWLTPARKWELSLELTRWAQGQNYSAESSDLIGSFFYEVSANTTGFSDATVMSDWFTDPELGKRVMMWMRRALGNSGGDTNHACPSIAHRINVCGAERSVVRSLDPSRC